MASIKIEVIKEVRSRSILSLKQSKNAVEKYMDLLQSGSEMGYSPILLADIILRKEEDLRQETLTIDDETDDGNLV